jgi:hypothetical protein
MESVMKLLALASFFITTAYAAANGLCGFFGIPGVCVPAASCRRDDGNYVSDFCPDDLPDIKCCIKTFCGNNGMCEGMEDRCLG